MQQVKEYSQGNEDTRVIKMQAKGTVTLEFGVQSL